MAKPWEGERLQPKPACRQGAGNRAQSAFDPLQTSGGRAGLSIWALGRAGHPASFRHKDRMDNAILSGGCNLGSWCGNLLV